MPGLGRRTFAPGEVLTATNVMGYLQDQAVMNFAGTAARGSAIGSAVSQGMVSYLDDTNSIEVYKTVGTAVAGWEPVNLAQSPNIIINGGLDIWQRGTSFAVGIGVPYTADRWQVIRGSGTAGMTVSRQATGLTSFQYCLRAQRDSGDTNTTAALQVFQSIESAESIKLAGKTVTFSFYARAGANFSATGSAVNFALKTGTSTDANVRVGGFSGSATDIANTNFTLTTSWARYFVTATVPANSTQLGFIFSYTGTGTAGAADFFDITGVQLEAGSTPTVFRRNANSVQGELATCQRYYWRWTQEVNLQSTAIGYLWGAGEMLFHFNTPVQLRATPTTVGYSAPSATYFLGNGTNYTGATNPVSVWGSRNHVSFLFTGTGATTNQVAHVRPPLNTFFFADAEL